MTGRPIRTLSLGTLFLALAAAVALGQSLADLARKEKERRKQVDESGVGVKEGLGSRLPRAKPEPPRNAALTPPAPMVPASKRVAPDFSLEDRDGRRVSLSDYRGQPVLIDFWASWCGPCRKSMPAIEQLYNKYRPQGLQVVGINIEGRGRAALDYLAAGKYTFPVLFDSGNWGSPVAQSYGVRSIPRTFLIDGDGNVVYEGHPSSLPEPLIEAVLR